MMNLILSLLLPIFAFVILLICGAFFASSETAFTSLTRLQARQLVKGKKPHANLVFVLRNNLDFLISTVLVGTNFITSLLSALATAFTVKFFGSAFVSVASFVVSIFVIIFSEIIPKTYAAFFPQEVALNFSPIIWLFGNLSAVLNLIEKKLFKNKSPLITEDELKTLIEVGSEEGTLEKQESKLLERLFEFSDLRVKDIMRHRSFVRYVSEKDSLEKVIETFALAGYSRLPVYKDSPETIIGVLHYKSVLFASEEITKSRDFVRICMRPVEFVPATLTALELLQRFKRSKDNFAVAVNEYGSLAGVVTMEDILYAVFGRMTDEYGLTEVAPEKRIKVSGINEFIVPGDMKLDDVNEVLNLSLDSEYFDTLGGYLLEHFGQLPSIGEAYKNEDAIFLVEDQSSRRIQTVRIRLL